jgi:hypothetical protein
MESNQRWIIKWQNIIIIRFCTIGDANYLLNNVTSELHKYVTDKEPQNTDDFIFM